MAVYRHGKYSFQGILDEGDDTLRSDDSEIWVRRFAPVQRFNVPMQFVIGIDGRKIGFSLTQKLSEFFQKIDPVANLPIYEINYFGIEVVRLCNDGHTTRTNSEKFADMTQQERALRFIIEGFLAVPSLTPKKTKEGLIGAIIQFSPELTKKFQNGDFIEPPKNPWQILSDLLR